MIGDTVVIEAPSRKSWFVVVVVVVVDDFRPPKQTNLLYHRYHNLNSGYILLINHKRI